MRRTENGKRITKTMLAELVQVLKRGMCRGHEAEDVSGDPCCLDSGYAIKWSVDGAAFLIWGKERAFQSAHRLYSIASGNRSSAFAEPWKALVDYVDTSHDDDATILDRLNRRLAQM